jgi:hypothetical protein
MTTNTFSNLTVMTLPDLRLTSGRYEELNFYAYTSNGSPIDIRSASCSWSLTTYSTPHVCVLEKSGSVTVTGSVTNCFTIPIYSSDTIVLSGKFYQQPKTTPIQGFDYGDDIGVVTIVP